MDRSVTSLSRRGGAARLGVPLMVMTIAMTGGLSRAEAQNPRSVELGPPEPQALVVGGHEVVPRFVLEPAGTDPSVESSVFAPMIFALAGRDQPVILLRDAGRWSVRRFETLGDWELVGVVGGRQVWAVLDSQWENSRSPVTLIRSTDGGQSWHQMGTVPKPSNWARFENLRLGALGHGRLTYAVPMLDEGITGEEVLPGLYHYRTEDSGRTWSEPEFEPDGLRRAATTAAHSRAGWDPSVHQHPLWLDYYESAPKEGRLEFEGITWSDQGSSVRVLVHTSRRLEDGWHHASLRQPPRELVVVRGLEPVDSQELPVGSDLVEAVRVGTHWKEGQGEIHVVLDLATPTAYVRSIQVVEETDLEIVLARR